MYTQCPNCKTAFRVTADVLKAAAGKVRCGGCNDAFNALLYLSEQMPDQRPATDPEAALPELTPEPAAKSTAVPHSISAEQSAALLKTLDELAGSDIRIEDTGVEWRVLDDDESPETSAGTEAIFAAPGESTVENELFADSDASMLDELLLDSPTPVDEFLTKTPEVVEAAEIFAESDNELTSTSVDELRFDDDTPLPDDFDLDDESSYLPVAKTALDEEPDPDIDADESHPDITLSEPEEWSDILGEFEDHAEDPVEEVATPSIEALDNVEDSEEGTAETRIQDDLSHDDPLDMDTQFALQAEAMGIDLSGMHELEPAEEAEIEIEAEALEEQVEFSLDAEAHIELAAELADDLDEALNDDDSENDDLRLRLDAVSAQLDDFEEQHEPVIGHHTIEEELAALGAGEIGDEEVVEEPAVEELSEEELSVNMLIDQDLMALAIEDEDGFASTIIIPDDEAEAALHSGKRQKLAPTSEDAAARFESIVMEGETVSSELDEEKLATDSAAAAELAVLYQTTNAYHNEQSNRMRNGIIGGIAALVLLLLVQVLHQSREALATMPVFNHALGPIYRAIGQPIRPNWDITGWRIEASDLIVAGDTPAVPINESGGDSLIDNIFSDNVTSAGDTPETSENLTIYSRIGNKSDRPLPYPLIWVSLTDRFEETTGTLLLTPEQYLADNLDPGEMVPAGNSFEAFLSIQSNSTDATGYRLDTCYRMSDEQLRCAIDDFK